MSWHTDSTYTIQQMLIDGIESFSSTVGGTPDAQINMYGTIELA